MQYIVVYILTKKYSTLLTILVVKKVSNLLLFLAFSQPLEIYVLSIP